MRHRILRIGIVCVAAFALTGCINLGHDSDRNSTDTQTDLFRQILDGVPKGKQFYWLGACYHGYRLDDASLPTNLEHGVEIQYASATGRLYVVTYFGRTAPPPASNIASNGMGAEFARRITSTGQLVLLGATSDRPSRAAARRILDDLSPVSYAGIKQLPPYWVNIP
jgi:hypothetical protein